MRSLYHRIYHHISFNISIMENHVYKFLNIFGPAFGLLRSPRRKLPAKTSEDIESGGPDLIQSRPRDDATDAAEDISQPQSSGNLETNLEDGLLQPQFTEGRSQFVLAKDGSKDCVALLVNESFLAKLRDLFQENRDVSALDGPFFHAKMDIKNIEHSIQITQESLETAESEEQAEEYRNFIKQQTSELLKIRHRKDELEKERDRVKGNLEFSRSHTQWVLETAMREADLLGPEMPLPSILLRKEPESADEEVGVSEHEMPAQSPVISVASDHEEIEASEEEVQRRAAYDDFVDRSQLLDTIQTNFDDQQDNYHENLARFLENTDAGTNEMSRSDFDRRSIQYGQELTRALIDAEEAFEQAKERARALGAIGSDCGQGFNYGAEYEESWPENKIADYIAHHDWSSIENWRNNIPDCTSQADIDSVEIDEWDAREVEVNDSISNIDCDDYRQDIDRWQRQCARLEDPCPEARLFGQPDACPLERRHSLWM